MKRVLQSAVFLLLLLGFAACAETIPTTTEQTQDAVSDAEFLAERKKVIRFDGQTFVFDMKIAEGACPTEEIRRIAYDNSLDCFHPTCERMQVREVFETEAYILANIKYDCVYDVLVYDKTLEQASWLSGAGAFQTYHKEKIDMLKEGYADAETTVFPYKENRVLSISPDAKYALIEKTRGESVETLAVEYHICWLDTLASAYLFDGFTTECTISWMEDAYAWPDADTLRIASWTDRYDDLYRTESIRRAEVFDVFLSENSVSVSESDAAYDYSENRWRQLKKLQ